MAHFIRTLILALLALNTNVGAQETLVLASTTSTEQSGLFGWILPRFEAASGIRVKVVAVGTGQALEIGRRGDADVLLVHDRAGEDKFVADGWGAYRKDVMYNDFVLVGPQSDPAGVRGAKNIVAALLAIDKGRQGFISRGDKSGTHAAEIRLWQEAAVDPRQNPGYKQAGSGMGPTLNMAAALDAYTLADRATWGAFKNRRQLDLLFAGDPQLFNPYGVIPVNPARHPHVQARAAEQFVSWLTGPAGREAIAAFRADGQQVFFPSTPSSR